MLKKKWADPFIESNPQFVIPDPQAYKGKWKEVFKNNNPIPAPEALNPENVTKYVDQSLDVIRIGVATAVMNMLTSAFAIILIILAILSVIK